MHKDFLVKVLTSPIEQEYWAVSKMDYVNRYGSIERGQDEIIFIAIPDNIRRGLNRDEILLVDLETLSTAPIDKNIYLNKDYTPFQNGVTMYNVYDGFPITGDVRLFLSKALVFNGKHLLDYKELLNKEPNPETSVATGDAKSTSA